jgi:hypothetical protein
MHVLNSEGLSFFKEELLSDTENKIKFLEKLSYKDCPSPEIGRIHLYEQRAIINQHFEICDSDIAVFLTNHPSHGLLGKVKETIESASLCWLEKDGIRYSLIPQTHKNFHWKNSEPPPVRLTETGTLKPKPLLTL